MGQSWKATADVPVLRPVQRHDICRISEGSAPEVEKNAIMADRTSIRRSKKKVTRVSPRNSDGWLIRLPESSPPPSQCGGTVLEMDKCHASFGTMNSAARVLPDNKVQIGDCPLHPQELRRCSRTFDCCHTILTQSYKRGTISNFQFESYLVNKYSIIKTSFAW